MALVAALEDLDPQAVAVADLARLPRADPVQHPPFERALLPRASASAIRPSSKRFCSACSSGRTWKSSLRSEPAQLLRGGRRIGGDRVLERRRGLVAGIPLGEDAEPPARGSSRAAARCEKRAKWGSRSSGAPAPPRCPSAAPAARTRRSDRGTRPPPSSCPARWAICAVHQVVATKRSLGADLQRGGAVVGELDLDRVRDPFETRRPARCPGARSAAGRRARRRKPPATRAPALGELARQVETPDRVLEEAIELDLRDQHVDPLGRHRRETSSRSGAIRRCRRAATEGSEARGSFSIAGESLPPRGRGRQPQHLDRTQRRPPQRAGDEHALGAQSLGARGPRPDASARPSGRASARCAPSGAARRRLRRSIAFPPRSSSSSAEVRTPSTSRIAGPQHRQSAGDRGAKGRGRCGSRGGKPGPLDRRGRRRLSCPSAAPPCWT